jgi:hypothetical protein
MRLKRMVLVLVALAAIVPAGCGGKEKAANATTVGDIKLGGAVTDSRTWSVDGLASLPGQQTQEVGFLGEGMQKSIKGTGVLLYDLLQKAKPKFDAKKKRDALRYAVLVHATDNYATAIAWGEIDPDFANKPILVTVEENGKKLGRPGLLVPGDKHGGRHIYDMDRITLEALS